jgi:hypothetical protein
VAIAKCDRAYAVKARSGMPVADAIRTIHAESTSSTGDAGPDSAVGSSIALV